MLRVNRVFGPEERWSKASAFAAAFHGGCWQGTGGESKISRWETATLRVPYQAIRRYEQLLELPPGLLTSTADNIHGYHCPDPRCPGADGWSLPRHADVPVARISELIDKAGSTDVMTGQEWDELTREISSVPRFFISPATTWTVLAERLLQEQIMADRVAWSQRYGGLVRLLNHPVAQQAAIAACASLAADRTNQIGIEVICALDVTGHPDAARHVLAQLASPTNDKTFYGALLACVRKVSGGHFDPVQLRYLASVVTGLLGDPVRHDDATTLAASLLRQLPGDVPPDVRRKLRRSLAADEALSHVLDTGRLATEHPHERVDRIVAATAARMPREGPWPHDQTLAEIVEEMLYSPVPDVRLYAAFLVHATPYRAPIAAELAAELRQLATASHTDLAVSLMDALRLIGGPAERPVVEGFALNPRLPAPVTAAAARNIGHLGGTSDDRFWTRAVDLQCQLLKRRAAPARESILRALVYGLGISRNDTLLARIRDLPDMPWQARQAATWWLGHPQRVRLSAAL
jgi:hypothetical protein